MNINGVVLTKHSKVNHSANLGINYYPHTILVKELLSYLRLSSRYTHVADADEMLDLLKKTMMGQVDTTHTL
jgi:hypothetical protein